MEKKFKAGREVLIFKGNIDDFEAQLEALKIHYGAGVSMEIIIKDFQLLPFDEEKAIFAE